MKLSGLLFLLFSFPILSKSQCYEISTINYFKEDFEGTSIQLGDDEFSNRLPIGFNFCFFGIITDSLQIGSNGVITFLQDNFENYCQPNILNVALPNAFSSTSPKNCIMLPWQDLNPGLGGLISYSLQGTDSNRYFIVNYDSVPMKGCDKYFSGQVKIFESTYKIETHILQKDTCTFWNEAKAVHGLHGTRGILNNVIWALGEFVEGRNYPSLVWEIENEGVLFNPICDACATPSVTGLSYESEEQLISVFPNPIDQILYIKNGFKNPNLSLEIFAIDGRNIKRLILNFQENISIDVSDLKSGIYLLKVVDNKNNKMSIQKIIKN